LFRLSSLVKPLASAAIQALVARGELALDEPDTVAAKVSSHAAE
jgi:CubicO group peptidase (beta-lactamase class C family)